MPDFFLDDDLDFAFGERIACSRAIGAMAASKPFPLAGDKAHYARDLVVDVRHIKLEIAIASGTRARRPRLRALRGGAPPRRQPHACSATYQSGRCSGTRAGWPSCRPARRRRRSAFHPARRRTAGRRENNARPRHAARARAVSSGRRTCSPTPITSSASRTTCSSARRRRSCASSRASCGTPR